MVRVTQVYAHYRNRLQTEPLLMVEGIVQHQDGVVNLLADSVAPMRRGI